MVGHCCVNLMSVYHSKYQINHALTVTTDNFQRKLILVCEHKVFHQAVNIMVTHPV